MEPRLFAFTSIASVVYAITVVAGARAIGYATDHVIVPAARGQLAVASTMAASGLIVTLAFIRGASFVVRRYLNGVFQFRVEADSRRKLAHCYVLLPQIWHARHDRGELLSTINTDVDSAWMPLSRLALACSGSFMLVGAVIDMYLTDVVLAVIGTLLFPAIGLLNWFNLRMSAVLAKRVQALRGEVSTTAHESFGGALVVKTLGNEEVEVARFAHVAGRLRQANVALGRVGAFFDPAMEAVTALGVLAVLWVGILRINGGGLGIGELVHMTYLITAIAFPLRSIGWFVSAFSQSTAGRERIQAVITEPVPASPDPLVAHTGSRQTIEPALVIRNVSFAYPGADEPAVTGVDFSVPTGATVALVGATGSGKSTLAQLVAGLWTPSTGSIEIYGSPPACRLDELAYVPQHAFLFRETVRFNITLGDEIPDERIWRALRVVQAEGFVGDLPLGLEQPVGEYGTTLSGGQRQRIALARALVRRPSLLILDDATSALDPRVEAQVLDALHDGRTKPTTTLTISSRSAVVQRADTVIRLAGGRVAECGPHQSLWNASGLYRELISA
ncbi:ABC transporter ATP-binding protein [Streptomyces sp. NPDC004752]